MNEQRRCDSVDVLRGFAFVQMFVYHFFFVLHEFNLAFENFTDDAWWLHFRTLIVSQFLLLVGISLKLATVRGIRLKSYVRRLSRILIYGLVVVAVTYWLAPHRVVVFGVLQFIFVVSILGLLFLNFGRINLLIAFFLLVFGNFYQSEFFDRNSFHWLGLMTHKPVTLDYVPILPWLGVVLVGIYLGDGVTKLAHQHWFKQWRAASLPSKMLVLFGQNSLNLYMMHMPLIFVSVYLIAKLQ